MTLVLVTLALLFALVVPAPAQQPEQPRTGGVFRVAMIGEPPTLDVHTTTAVIVQQITWHVYETLYTYDRQYNAVPLLVESHTVTDNGRTYVFRLRRGVKFHNGKELTAADVVASLKRWGRLATPGKQLWKNVEGVEAKDASTVAMYVKDASGALLMGLARPNNGAVIYPTEIVDAAGDNPIKEYIGTGPYRFVEHKPDRHVRLARFKDYAARGDARHGADHGRGLRQQGLLSARSRSVVPRAAAVALARGGRPLQPEESREGEEAAAGGGLRGPARALDHDEGISVDVQERARGEAAAGGGGVQDRSAGGGLGHARAAAQQARAVGCLLDRHHVQSRAGLQHRRELQLAGLVVSRGQGAVDGRARTGERSPKAARDVGEGAADLLRGRRAREVRRLLRSRRRP